MWGGLLVIIYIIATVVRFPNQKENPGQPYLLLEM